MNVNSFDVTFFYYNFVVLYSTATLQLHIK